MAVDPFAPAGAVEGTDEFDDMFMDPSRGQFPRLPELLHKLLWLVPVEVTKVQKLNSKTEMIDRWSIDTTVIRDVEDFTTYERMYWSQTAISGMASRAYRDPKKKPILATLHLAPVQKARDEFPSEEALLQDEDIQRWLAKGGKGPAPVTVAWILEVATPEEKQLARNWWMENRTPFGSN